MDEAQQHGLIPEDQSGLPLAQAAHGREADLEDPARASIPQEAGRFRGLVTHGLEQAARVGFDLGQSIQANYGGKVSAEYVADRAEKVVHTAAEIADDLRLDSAFFERPANSVLLAGIADAWITTEDRGSDSSYNRKIADEREMLGELGLVLGGNYSAAARELARKDPDVGSRYAATLETEDPKELERMQFLDGVCDRALTEQIQEAFRAEGVGSLLYDQRNALNVTAATEAPFTIKVVNMAKTRQELDKAGITEPTEWPDWLVQLTDPVAIEARIQAGREAAVFDDRQEAIAKPYAATFAEYETRFGNVPLAWVDHYPDGSKILYLRAPDASRVIKQSAQPGGFDGEMFRDTRDAIANIRHEYAHTQKSLLMGARTQLGLLLEERKAELISGDKQGYEDIKYLVTDLTFINDVNLLAGIEGALKQPDALSAFTAWAANNLGLHTMLLLTASKPRKYDEDRDSRERFTDLYAVREAGDVSVHDAILRRDLAAKGPDRLRQHAAAIAGSAVARHGVEGAPRYKSSSREYLSFRRLQGVSRTARYYQEAVDAAVARAKAA